MEFAINYSTQAGVLACAGRLKLDRFKLPDWPDLILEAQQRLPVAVHFGLDAGRARLSEKKMKRALEIADQTGTPYVNLHLGCKRGDFPENSLNSTNSQLRRAVYERIRSDIILALQVVPAERLILENVPFRPNGNVLRAWVDPSLIRGLVEETGCGFLLDIPHARISAHYLGVDERLYMLSLPVERVRELHFTGVQTFGELLLDHLPALDGDWRALEWVLARIKDGTISAPWMLALEYGGVGEKFNWRSSAQDIESQGNCINKLINNP